MANTISLQEIQNNMTQKLSEKANVNHNHNNQYLSLEQAGELNKLVTTKKTSLVDAVNELFQFASDGKTKIATAITGKGINASGTETFDSLTSKINTIETNPLKDELTKTVDAFKTELYTKLNEGFYVSNENAEKNRRINLIDTLKVTNLTSNNSLDEILAHLYSFRQYLNDYMISNNFVTQNNLKIEDLMDQFNIKTNSYKITEGWISNRWFTNVRAMNTPRSSLCSAVVNKKIYVFGGNNSQYNLTVVEEYDSNTNTWATKESMPTVRNSFSVSSSNNKIYVIGGSSNVVEEYNPFTNTWLIKQPMPTSRSNLATATINNKIYAIGGNNSTTGILSVVEEYNVITNTWVTKQSLSRKRMYLTASSVNNKIYAIGGLDVISAGNDVLNILEQYDPSTNEWSVLRGMSDYRYGLTSSVVNNKIYAFGGTTKSDRTDLVEEYNPITDLWVTKKAMPVKKYLLTSNAVDNKIYVIGGYDYMANHLSRVDVYYP